MTLTQKSLFSYLFIIKNKKTRSKQKLFTITRNPKTKIKKKFIYIYRMTLTHESKILELFTIYDIESVYKQNLD